MKATTQDATGKTTTREVRLAARPQGWPKASDFELAEVPLAEPGPGEVLVRNVWMSVDPYMRGRMNDAKSYVAPFRVGEALEGGAIGRVVASRHPGFAEGDAVSSMLGWREHFVSDGSGLAKVDARRAPLSAYLGALGMPGMTAWVGMLDIGKPREGETVFVSGAAGAVGSAAGQIAKLKGARVVGSAGSPDKVAHLTDDLGFDAAFDYKAVDLDEALAGAAPAGVDVYFDNVGGEHLRAALARVNPFARIPLCGMISVYNDETPPPGPNNLATMVRNRVTMQGFIVSDHFARMPEFHEEMGAWVAEGKVKYRETVLEGIEKAPEAFLGLLGGENVGKMLVRLHGGPDEA